MFTERTSVGLDVHARSVVAAAVDGVTGEVFRARLTPGNDDVIGWVRSLPGPSAAVYEAGPTGFGLARAFMTAGVRCEVAAPSKIQRPAGDRVKTDARDAMLLARLLRLDDIVSVRVPSVAREAARDLVRVREDVRGDLMRARHRVSKLLLRQGIVYYGGHAWTRKHLLWLRKQHFDAPGLQLAFDAEHEAVLQAEARRDRLDKAIAAMAADSEYTPVVHRQWATGMTLAVPGATGFVAPAQRAVIGGRSQAWEAVVGGSSDVLTLAVTRSKRASQGADLRKRGVGPVGFEPTTYGLKGPSSGGVNLEFP